MSGNLTLESEPVTYLARDYEALRQCLLDRLAVTMPDWPSRYPPDVGMTLVELIAFLGDRLAYYQDAVATEAYVGTARRRISVRRHARLVDESIHDGCNARVLLQVPKPDGLALESASFTSGNAEVVFTAIPATCLPVFEPLALVAPVDVDATSAKLGGSGAPSLRRGGVLLFRDGPDGDEWAQSHAVRIRDLQPVDGAIEVSWSWEDRVPFAMGADSSIRGDVLCAEHAEHVVEPLAEDRRLGRHPLTFSVPVSATTSMASILHPDPRSARPMVSLVELDADVRRPRWEWRPDLIGSSATDRHFTIEVDDDEVAHVRFGDGACGRAPASAKFEVEYYVGNGVAGNIRRRTLVRSEDGDISVSQNVVARGGVDAETVAAFRSRLTLGSQPGLRRAVVPEDYAQIAESHPRVQRAAAVSTWTGTSLLVRVAIDTFGVSELPQELELELEEILANARRIGHEVSIERASYVVVDVWLDVVVRTEHTRAAVAVAVRAKVRELLHPDELTFGQPVLQSAIVAAVRSIAGVESIGAIDVTRQQDQVGLDELGILRVGPLEIVRFEDREERPELGRLELRLRGGR